MNRGGRSLSRRFAVSIGGILLGVSLLFICFTWNTARTDVSERLSRRADEYVHSLADILGEPMWSLNRDAVRDIGASYALNKEVSALFIRGSYGKISFEYRKEGEKTAVGRKRPVEYQGRTVGTVHIELTAGPVQAANRERLHSLFINLAVLMVVVLPLAVVVLRRLLKPPLAFLEREVAGFALGERSEKSERVYMEFQPTVDAVADMAETISRQMGDLREAERKFRTVFENAVEGMFMTTPDGRISGANPAAAAIFGYASPEEMQQQVVNLAQDLYVNPEDRKRAGRIVRETGGVVGFETRMRRRDGRLIWVSLSARVVYRDDGEVDHYEGSIIDITERRESEALYRLIFENANDAILLLKGERFVDCNSKSLEVYGCSREELLGRTLKDFSPRTQPDGQDSVLLIMELVARAADGMPQFFEWVQVRADGSAFDAEVSLNSVDFSDGTYLQAIVRDITDRKETEEALRTAKEDLEQRVDERTAELIEANAELHRLSNMDPLTGLFNRRRLNSFLEDEWKRLRRLQEPMAVIMCDIDYFKPFNDTYGHQAGDECLASVGEVLRSSLKRPADFAARYGGEEFTIVLPHTDSEGAFQLAEEVMEAVEEMDLPHTGSPFGRLTLSFGVASMVPGRDNSSESLLFHADGALYGSKERGRNRVTLWKDPRRGNRT